MIQAVEFKREKGKWHCSSVKGDLSLFPLVLDSGSQPLNAVLLLLLFLFPKGLQLTIHFTPWKPLSRASRPHLHTNYLSKEAVTPWGESLGPYHWQKKGHKPDPAKFCQTTCHMLLDSSCQHSCNPVYHSHHKKENAFKLEGLHVFFLIKWFLPSDKRGQISAVLRCTFRELIKASFSITSHSSSPAPPVTNKTGLGIKKTSENLHLYSELSTFSHELETWPSFPSAVK